jgi:hypothetical protein
MGTTFLSLVNKVLVRLNEVTLDPAGAGFDSVRNVQALAKEAVNSSVRMILQDGQEWPFLKNTQTQVLTAGTRMYSFPSDFSVVDWDTFYLKRLTAKNNIPTPLKVISYENYTVNYRSQEELADVDGRDSPQIVYQTYESKFGLTPVPDEAYEVEYVYWSAPLDMSTYNTECVIPSRFDHVILEGALMAMMRFRSNEQSAVAHQNNFETNLKAMRRVLLDEVPELRSTVIHRSYINAR